jgi:hypothetical protein
LIVDEQWPVARLIPISAASGVEAQERRAASALLAVVAAVPEFGRALLKPMGAPAGKIESFIEIPFKVDGRTIRPDGIIAVSRGQKRWGAIVETKVGGTALEPGQIEGYLDLARDLGFDAVLSISNHYVTSSSRYPIEVDKRKLRRVALHHWSWVSVLTEAVVQKEHRGVSDPDQAYILNELIRYLSDPRSGAVTFDSMGPQWTRVRDGARERTLRKGDEGVEGVATRWDDLVRYVGLELTKDLGRDVKQILDSSEATPTARLAALKQSLANAGRLYAELHIPDVAGPLRVAADLRSRQILVSTRIDAPREGTSRGRVSWLLRQLQTAPGNLKVEARAARATGTLAASVQEVREDPSLLYPTTGKEIRQFLLTVTHNMGLKGRAGRGSFINTVVESTKGFYGDVLQNLKAWKPSPPKLKKPTEEKEEAASERPLPKPVEEAIETAGAEMTRVEPQVEPESTQT